MDSSLNHISPKDFPDKGKGRAQNSTERTPLLDGQSSSSTLVFNDHETATPREEFNRQLRSRLTMVFLVSLCLCIVSFALLAMLAWSYAAEVSKLSPDDVVRDALVLQGPDRVDVHKITWSGEIWLTVNARLGLDAGIVTGVNSKPGDTLVSGWWKAFGRWGIQQLDRVTLTLSTITIASRSDPSIILASVSASPMVVSLAANPPNDASWLTPVSIPVVIRPNNDTSAWIQFIRESWRQGSIDVQANVGRAVVHGGSENEKTWRTWVYQKMSDVKTSMHFRIPPIPGLPAPGDKNPFPSVHDLITLTTFHIASTSNKLDIRALATVFNPVPPQVNTTTPSIPFVVSLPCTNSARAPIPVASVSTAPLILTHPNITLEISGTVLPISNNAAPVLSSFLSQYLSGKANDILIATPLISNLTIQTIFPPLNPPPRILRNVTIKDMKIKPGTTFLASGTIFARIVLPEGVDVDLIVSRVFPDVLVFDGDVPDTDGPQPVPPPLPDPLPEGAFGHIRPNDWLKAASVRNISDEEEGASYVVTAKIVDVPIEVLPGRQKEFSNFVSKVRLYLGAYCARGVMDILKVVFGSDGANAGILGSTAVAARVRGLPLSGNDGEMELSRLPLKGSVRLGKKNLFTSGHFDTQG
ncbi:hypothetical protein C0993_009320 [Termitomyces sp. T159_Od127]|nr:hypothetical protein C0993_009320 [Termitomyces sp. T159_Od127]